MAFYNDLGDKFRTYGIRKYLDYTGEYGYFSIYCGVIVFGDKCRAYVFKKRDAKKVLKDLQELFPNDEFEIVKIS